jgi:alcohol dehydrogenase
MRGILGYTDEPLVSSDYLGDPRSPIVDATLTLVMGDRFALAMGASRVLAVGRDAGGLDRLRAACGSTVVPVVFGADEAANVAALREASAVGPHEVLDFVGQTDDRGATRACVRALRRAGTAVFMGGVNADVPAPYREAMLNDLTVRGCFMHPPTATANVVRMAAAGTVPLGAFRAKTFELARVNEAVEHAARDKVCGRRC